MKKITLLLTVFLIMLFAVPVFAEDSVTVESVKLINSTENLIASEKKMEISFDDLEQYAKYEVVLKNNTEENLFINDLNISKASEDFIHFILDEESVGTKVNAGKTAKVNVLVKTLEIEGAGKNTNDKISLKLKLEEAIENPATGNNSTELILSIILLGMLMFVCFYKSDKKVKVSIVVITLLLLGTTTVLADDEIAVLLEGNVSYKSQNLMQSSGTTVTNNTIDYSTSEKVWKYYDKVKNVNISSISKFEIEYEEEFDLTIGENSRVKGYLVKSGAEDMYDLHIASRGVIYAPTDATALFSFPKAEKINGLENVVFEETKTFTGMFMGNEEMTEANVESIDFTNAEDTSHMFTKCYELEVEEENLNIPEEAKNENTFIQYMYDEVKKSSISDKNINFASTSTTGKYFIESTKEDEYPVYYYRGAVTNNNVKFANFCWKIVRTTETGGIKIIYNGVPSATGACNSSGQATTIGSVKFNCLNNSIEHASYIYENGTDSLLKAYIDDWYEKNMLSFTKRLEDTIWCNDREFVVSDSPEYTVAYNRIVDSSIPTLSCKEEYSLLVNTSDISRKLKYPVATISADEALYAGLTFSATGKSNYLFVSGVSPWTMTATRFEKSQKILSMFRIFYSKASIKNAGASSGGMSAKPMVSLKNDIHYIGGTGTVNDPYIVE